MSIITNKEGKEYILKEALGGGAFGTVYEANDKHGNKYAIKQIIIKDPNHIQMFLNEINVLKKLSLSPNCHQDIVCIYDSIYDRFHNIIYVVMELIDGDTLYVGSIKPSEKLLKSCSETLSFIHSKKLVHRDIKPQNIMITKQGKIKFVDFGTGCSISEDPNIDICKGTAGTDRFLDPRFFIGEINTACRSSDIYALGATFYMLMTEENPPNYVLVDVYDQQGLYYEVLSKLETTKYSEKLKKIVGAMLNPGSKRPSSEEIITFLNGGELTLNGYDGPEICQTKISPIDKSMIDIIFESVLELKKTDEELELDVSTNEEYIKLAIDQFEEKGITVPEGTFDLVLKKLN